MEDPASQAPQGAPAEPDFAAIAARATRPILRERLAGPLLWAAAIMMVGVLSFGAMVLLDEWEVQQAMQVVANEAPAALPAALPALTAAAATTPGPLILVDAAPPAPKAAPPRKPLPRTLRRATRLAAHPQVSHHKAKPAKAAARQERLSVAMAQRCKSGDLVRQCMARLCREGRKGSPACQALSALER